MTLIEVVLVLFFLEHTLSNAHAIWNSYKRKKTKDSWDDLGFLLAETVREYKAQKLICEVINKDLIVVTMTKEQLMLVKEIIAGARNEP